MSLPQVVALSASTLTPTPSTPLVGTTTTWTVTITTTTAPAAGVLLRCAFWNGIGSEPSDYIADSATLKVNVDMAQGSTTTTCTIPMNYTSTTSGVTTAKVRVYYRTGTVNLLNADAKSSPFEVRKGDGKLSG